MNSSGKVEIYVGLIVPNHLGGKSLNYRICFGNSTEDCKNGLVSLFGNPGTTHDKKLPISSCHFNVREILVSFWESPFSKHVRKISRIFLFYMVSIYY